MSIDDLVKKTKRFAQAALLATVPLFSACENNVTAPELSSRRQVGNVADLEEGKLVKPIYVILGEDKKRDKNGHIYSSFFQMQRLFSEKTGLVLREDLKEEEGYQPLVPDVGVAYAGITDEDLSSMSLGEAVDFIGDVVRRNGYTDPTKLYFAIVEGGVGQRACGADEVSRNLSIPVVFTYCRFSGASEYHEREFPPSMLAPIERVTLSLAHELGHGLGFGHVCRTNNHVMTGWKDCKPPINVWIPDANSNGFIDRFEVRVDFANVPKFFNDIPDFRDSPFVEPAGVRAERYDGKVPYR